MVVQTAVPATKTVTVAPGSAVPPNVGEPVDKSALLAGTIKSGGAGAVASMVNPVVALTGDVLPAMSVAVAVTVWGPSPSGVPALQLNVPEAVATALQALAPSTVT